MSLLPADLREALTQARLNALGARSIHGIGERVSRDKGAGLEFADHRGYQPGDDMRHLDVSVYSRLRQPVVRQFHPERQLDVVLLVDGTASMDFGTPNKFVFATRVAAGLACAGLAGSDRVTVGVVGSGSLQASRRFSGTHRFHELSAWLEEREPSGHLDLEEALEVALPNSPPRASSSS